MVAFVGPPALAAEYSPVCLLVKVEGEGMVILVIFWIWAEGPGWNMDYGIGRIL